MTPSHANALYERLILQVLTEAHPRALPLLAIMAGMHRLQPDFVPFHHMVEASLQSLTAQRKCYKTALDSWSLARPLHSIG